MAHSHGSSHANKHPYLRPEMWISELVFWNTPYHKPGAYDDFHQRQINEAGRMNKQGPQNHSYYKVRAVEKVEKPKEEPKEDVPYNGETKKCRIDIKLINALIISDAIARTAVTITISRMCCLIELGVKYLSGHRLRLNALEASRVLKPLGNASSATISERSCLRHSKAPH